MSGGSIGRPVCATFEFHSYNNPEKNSEAFTWQIWRVVEFVVGTTVD